MESQGHRANQAHSAAVGVDFLKTRVVALYYSLTDMAMRL